MKSENNNNEQTQAKKVEKETKPNKRYVNPFRMNILDDIYDPFDDLFGFEDKMFNSFRNVFTELDLLSEKPKKEEEEKPKEEEIPKVEKKEEEIPKVLEPKEEEINTKMEEEEKPKEEEIPKVEKKEEEIPKVLEPKEEEINTKMEEEEEKPKEEEINTKMEEEKDEEKEEETKSKEEKKEPEKKLNEGTFYSKVYYSSYNNLNGKPNEESYQSQSIKKINNGHNISETKEAYKNSDGVEKTAYQRGLDDKTTRFIKERNTKTGKKDQRKVIKGIEENGIKDFNKEYDEFSKKCGFRKTFHNLDTFAPFGLGKKQLTYRNPYLFLPRLLF